MMKLEKEQFRKKKELRGRVRWTRKHEWILISLKYMVYLSNSKILLFRQRIYANGVENDSMSS